MIPNDVSNQARALKLLESAGLIKLKDNFGLSGTTKDIKDNPKHLKIKRSRCSTNCTCIR